MASTMFRKGAPFLVSVYSTRRGLVNSFRCTSFSPSSRLSLLVSVRVLMPERELCKSQNRRGFSKRSRRMRREQESPKRSATRATGQELHKVFLCCAVRSIIHSLTPLYLLYEVKHQT